MFVPWDGWEFHECLLERLENLKHVCTEDDPLPAVCQDLFKHVNDKAKDGSKNTGEQEPQSDDDEQSLNEAKNLPPSEDPEVNGLIVELADCNLGESALETLSTLTKEQFEYIMSILCEPAKLFLIETICDLGSSTLGSFVFSEFLFPQFRDHQQLPRFILLSAKYVVEKFPKEATVHFLGPLLLAPTISHQSTMAPFLTSLPSQQKLTLLRFLGDYNMPLTESQATVMNGLLMPLSDDQLRSDIISLIVASGTKLCNSAKFGQLLVTVIQKLGPSATEQQIEQLAILAMEHKSVARKVAERALRALK